MKKFTLIRLKTNGVSIHRVYVKSKQDALDLCWPDDSKLIGKFVTSRDIAFSPSSAV
jgi:hypothetical protein